jgi:AcrR family transcriptional regulator
VSEELWERTHPQELEEARERLAHYFRHYNHFRPHQALGRVTPVAQKRLDETRLRPCLGGRTACAVDAALSAAYTASQRAGFHEEVRRALEVAVIGQECSHELRRAMREVVFRALERHGLIRRTRGGSPFPSPKADTFSC